MNSSAPLPVASDPPTQLTIALVVRRYDHTGGGAERWTHSHAAWLLQAGCRVLVVCERATGVPEGAEVCIVQPRARYTRLSAERFASEVAAAIARHSPDITVGMGYCFSGDVVIPHYGTRAANNRARLAMRGPIKGLFRRISTAVLPHRRRLAEFERRMMERRPLVVAVSSMTAADLRSDLGLDPGLIRVVPNGVDLAVFRPASAAERKEARRALGIGEQPMALLVAHDFRLKGVSTAVRAVADMQGAGIGAPLLIVVGRDPARPNERLAERLGVGHLVRMEGAHENVLPFMHAADLLVHPTHYDPCSLVVLEAAACGLPVVTTSRNGAAERLVPGEECLVLDDPLDHSGLAMLMSRALEPAQSSAMRESAARSRAKLDSRTAHNALLTIYRSITESRLHGSHRAIHSSTPPYPSSDAPSA